VRISSYNVKDDVNDDRMSKVSYQHTEMN